MNKSLATNLLGLLVIGIGYISPVYGEMLKTIGFFAVSGSITNWIAIYMLFEKVPFLYGSGVIPARFEEFKSGIKNLIMNQFFTRDNIQRFFSDAQNSNSSQVNFDTVLKVIDYNKLFNDLLATIKESPMGGMLSMFGGEKLLEPLRDPFKQKVEISIKEITQSQEFISSVKESFGSNNISELIQEKIEVIVDKRLSELTPKMVKEMIQEMIRKHLGWLVVWGGVFGGLIGAVMELLKL